MAYYTTSKSYQSAQSGASASYESSSTSATGYSSGGGSYSGSGVSYTSRKSSGYRNPNCGGSCPVCTNCRG